MLKVAEKRYTPGQMQPKHAHDAMSVSMILRGSLRERVGRADVIGHALDIVVKPVDVEHANEFGPGPTTMLMLQFRPGTEAALGGASPALQQWSWQRLSPAVPAFLALHRVLLADAEPGQLETAACDALGTLAASAPREAAAAPRWLTRVREQLDDQVDSTTGGLATAAGVHPVYLARQFRRFFGCSITEYLRRSRAHRAAGRLGHSTDRLTTIALEAGYYDQPHLCRDFRRVTGLSPSQFRTLVGSPR